MLSEVTVYEGRCSLRSSPEHQTDARTAGSRGRAVHGGKNGAKGSDKRALEVTVSRAVHRNENVWMKHTALYNDEKGDFIKPRAPITTKKYALHVNASVVGLSVYPTNSLHCSVDRDPAS